MPHFIKPDCDCTAPIERDPVTGKALYKIGSAPVCSRCHRLQRAHELHHLSNYRRLGPGPTVLGGLPYATLGKP